MIEVTCTNEEKVPITAAPVTTSGAPANVDGALRVTVQSGDGTVEQDPNNPLSFFAVSGNNAGVTVFLVQADADLDEGEEALIQDTVELTVTSAAAASFGLTAGAPVAKTATPPTPTPV